jgi:hypothetical protein
VKQFAIRTRILHPGYGTLQIRDADRAEAALKKALELAEMFQARLMLANVYLKQQR